MVAILLSNVTHGDSMQITLLEKMLYYTAYKSLAEGFHKKDQVNQLFF